jgi:putative transposase
MSNPFRYFNSSPEVIRLVVMMSVRYPLSLRNVRAVDHEGEVLEAVVTARRDKAAALKLLKRIMKKYGPPRSVVTDGLCPYSAAMKEIGAADWHEVGGRLNNRSENSHQPFRRRERAMQRFRSMKTLQKFSSVHAQVQNHFNQERHLITR